LWPGRRRLAGDRGGGEVALGIAVAAEVEVVVPGPKKAAAVEVSLDPPDRTLQHIAHLAGLQVSKARKGKLAPSLMPGAIKCERCSQWEAMIEDSKEQKIARPRQVYLGSGKRDYTVMSKRG
jgi:hypothetical protein